MNDYVGSDGKNNYGKRQLRVGETSFFLLPGETLEGGKVKDNIILSEDEALLLLAREEYKDEYGVHKPGERWMVYGPRNYIQDIQTEVLEMRSTIPLDDNEGIYVRDIHSGEVKMVSGQTYMLKAHEELWKKELSDDVEVLLRTEGSCLIDKKDAKSYPPRNKSSVVTYMVPHNSLIQIFDYREKKNRIYLGPTVVKLGPYEQFTVIYLSGGIPKRENCSMNLLLNLGPDFFRDEIEVETSDHARLRLRLSYSWKFEVDKKSTRIRKIIYSKRFHRRLLQIYCLKSKRYSIKR